MNPIHNPVTLELGGKTRQLFYEHRDFATAHYLLQKQGWNIHILSPEAREFWDSIATGLFCRECANPLRDAVEAGEKTCKCGHAVDDAVAMFSQFHVGVLLFVGLCRTSPKLTLGEAQDLITFQNAAEVSGVVVGAAMKVLSSLIPEKDRPKQPEEASADASPLPSNSGGASAGPSEDTTLASPTKNSGDSGQMSLTSSVGDAT